MARCSTAAWGALVMCTGGRAFAQAAMSGTPPADEAAAVAAQKANTAPEEHKPSTDSTSGSANLGGQIATGNSQLVAVSAGGKVDVRRGENGFGAALIANYATGYNQPVPASMGMAAQPGAWKDTVRNLQGKIRYDRYFGRDAAIFLQVTGTHDAFQATTFRLNVDPGFKYLFVNHPKTKFWGEIGYDFEFDINYTDANGLEQAGAGGNVVDANGLPYVIQMTNTIHSIRAYLGFQHAFNKEVQLNAGFELLQALGGTGGDAPPVPMGYTAAQVDLVGTDLTRTRLNFDAVLAAHLAGAFSLGLGFTARYNSDPLPGKQSLDTTTTLSLVFSFTKPAPAAPGDAKCPPASPPPMPVVGVPTPNPSTDAATEHPQNLEAKRTNVLEATDWTDLASTNVAELAAALKAHPNVTVAIGSPDTPAVAEAVRTLLINEGVAADHVTTEVHPGHLSVRVTGK